VDEPQSEPDRELRKLREQLSVLREEAAKNESIFRKLMERELALAALDLALVDLDTEAGGQVEMSHPADAMNILDAIYFSQEAEPAARFDYNRDGVVDVLDVVHAIDTSLDR